MPVRIAVLLLATVALALPGCFGGVFGSDPPGPRDYVSSKDYDTWVIEIDTIQGMAPPASALNLLKARLESVANKPGGIELRTDDNLPARGGTWTLGDVEAYSKAHLDAKTKGDTVVLHLMFLDGRYSTDDVLGVTLSRSRDGKVVSTGPIAIFSDTIRDSCSLATLCTSSDPVWGPVLVHEFGHAMGLVDNGAPMKANHEDPGHPAHSNNRNSVMYWAVETSDVLTTFTGGIPSDFDANDRADLCGIGGKC